MASTRFFAVVAILALVISAADCDKGGTTPVTPTQPTQPTYVTIPANSFTYVRQGPVTYPGVVADQGPDSIVFYWHDDAGDHNLSIDWYASQADADAHKTQISWDLTSGTAVVTVPVTLPSNTPISVSFGDMGKAVAGVGNKTGLVGRIIALNGQVLIDVQQGAPSDPGGAGSDTHAVFEVQ